MSEDRGGNLLWFSHRHDLRRNPAILRVEQRLGEAGYARWLKLMEIVSQYGGKGDEFEPRIDLSGPATDERWLGDELRITTRELRKTLAVFAEVGLIEGDSLAERVIVVPMLTDLLDEFTKKKLRGQQKNQELSDGKSGLSPESVQSQSESNPLTIPDHTLRDRTVDVHPTRPSAGLDGGFTQLLRNSYNKQTNKSLSIGDKECQQLESLVVTKGRDKVLRAWGLFLHRSAGFDGLLHPVSKFIEEIDSLWAAAEANKPRPGEAARKRAEAAHHYSKQP